MSDTKEFWSGDFGNSYTKRNRVDWRARIPFWKDVLNLTGARSVFELGCNCGWNLSAIRRAYPDIETCGADVNIDAIQQAIMCGLDVIHVCSMGQFKSNNVDLCFTAGVLIHIAPEDLEKEMRRLVDLSAQYVLAVEYASDQEEEIEYRGHTGKLWRRPYGKLYQDMGLKLVKEWGAGSSFDRCTAWLLEKP